MQAKLYIHKELRQTTNKRARSVVIPPTMTVPVFRFNYGDLKLASVILEQESPSGTIPIHELSYLILEDGEKITHWFVQPGAFRFMANGKWEIGLRRNPWPSREFNELTTILWKRGMSDHVVTYKPNDLKVRKRVTRQIYVTDDFAKKTNDGVLEQQSFWGILYTNQLGEEANNPSIELEALNYSVTGTARDTRTGLYSGMRSSTANVKCNNRVVLLIYDRENQTDAAGYRRVRRVVYGVVNALVRPILDDRGLIYNPGAVIAPQMISSSSEVQAFQFLPGDLVFERAMLLSAITAQGAMDEWKATLAPDFRLRLNTVSVNGMNLLSANAAVDSYNRAVLQQRLVDANLAVGQTLTTDQGVYTYQSTLERNQGDGAVIQEGSNYLRQTAVLSTGQVTASTTSGGTGQSLQMLGVNFIQPNTTLSLLSSELLGRNFISTNYDIGVQQQVNPEIWSEFPSRISYWSQPINRAFCIGDIGTGICRIGEYVSPGGTTGLNLDVAMELNTHSWSYEALPGSVVLELDKGGLNNGIILAEPFGIVAIPLFEVGYIDDNTGIKKGNSIDAQKFFYSVIAKYSGGSTPFIADAQIIPYAPTIFKNWRGVDPVQGQYIDYRPMVDIIAQRNSYGGVPITMLESADINLEYYMTLNPYNDVQEEYTKRSYFIVSPGQDQRKQFDYYDYATIGATDNNFMAGPTVLGDFRLDVDITLKPHGLYMHVSPFKRNGSLRSITDFDDLDGLVVNNGIFQSSLVSSVFETYARENSMYENLQGRAQESMRMSQEAEKANEAMGILTNTLNATMMGATTGAAMADFTVMGNNAKGAGAIVGGAVAGVSAGILSGIQFAMNEKQRARELSDHQYYYEMDLQNKKNQPNVLARVSSLNQDILNKFCVWVEVEDIIPQLQEAYAKYVRDVGKSIGLNTELNSALVPGEYIQGTIFSSEEAPSLAETIKEDLEGGFYYYDEI